MLYLLNYMGATGQAICGSNADKSPIYCDTGLPSTGASSVQLQQVLQIALAVFGAVAVLIIVIAGLKFITAQGNPQSVSKARSTILYALIGLVVIASAEAIVTFVLGKL